MPLVVEHKGASISARHSKLATVTLSPRRSRLTSRVSSRIALNSAAISIRQVDIPLNAFTPIDRIPQHTNGSFLICARATAFLTNPLPSTPHPSIHSVCLYPPKLLLKPETPQTTGYVCGEVTDGGDLTDARAGTKRWQRRSMRRQRSGGRQQLGKDVGPLRPHVHQWRGLR